MRDYGNKGQEEIMGDLISVIMSTYNESLDEIKKSVESVLGQTYKRIEYIVVLDNPQNTEIKSYFKTLSDSRIKLIENKTNVGLVRSLNKALQIANGTYIARMDADDTVLSTIVVTFFNGLANGAAVVIAQYYGAKDKGRLHTGLHTAYLFSIVVSLVISVVGAVFFILLMNILRDY